MGNMLKTGLNLQSSINVLSTFRVLY